VKIAIVGTGYVGLVTGTCLAEVGHEVLCVDKDPGKIAILEDGGIPIYEDGLEALVRRNKRLGRLRFSTDLATAVKGRDAVFITVGTPCDEDSGHADLRYVLAAAREIGENLDRSSVIVTKSTVPVGTNRQVGRIVAEHLAPGIEVRLASNPEFLREGSAIADFQSPDRIVVGADDPAVVEVMRVIYEPFTSAGHELMVMEIETAELIKYAANAFLAVKISYINEIADLCESVGADVDKVARGIGADSRIGEGFLKVGPGWGGSCFPKDTRALDATAMEYGIPLRIVRAAMEANASRKRSLIDRVAETCDGGIRNKKFAVFGLTFKGQTDDMRESPSLDLLISLLSMGGEVKAFDPSAAAGALELVPDLAVADDPVSAAAGADAVIVMTDWREFLSYDLAEIAGVMADPTMIDLRNLFEEEAVLRSGFRRYFCIGRGRTREAEQADRSAA
jgi:UDPglucose 6-dehydrogenase